MKNSVQFIMTGQASNIILLKSSRNPHVGRDSIESLMEAEKAEKLEAGKTLLPEAQFKYICFKCSISNQVS